MSLISCPECDGRVSDKARNCPMCGYPLYEINYNDDGIEDEPMKESGFGVASLCIALVSVVIGWNSTNLIFILLTILAIIFDVIALVDNDRKSTCGVISSIILTFLIFSIIKDLFFL